MRIAIVNDMALAREVLRRVVSSVPGYAVAWLAVDGEEAVRLAAADIPDVILMDLIMPNLDGVEATHRIMRKHPCPILVVTVSVAENFESVCRALASGALDAVDTPTLDADGLVQGGERLLTRLRQLEVAKLGIRIPTPPAHSPSVLMPPVVAIGASTGGPGAIAEILSALPPGFPAAVVVAQHIGAEFAPSLAHWLHARCRLPVRPADEGDVLTAGEVVVAASDDHLILSPDRKLRYTAEPREYPFRPSVDVLFQSLAARGPRRGIGILLTGMGEDGADGLSRLRAAGWHTIAQDEKTSVVDGMPRTARERHAAVEILPLPRIGPVLLERVRDL